MKISKNSEVSMGFWSVDNNLSFINTAIYYNGYVNTLRFMNMYKHYDEDKELVLSCLLYKII